MKIKNNIILRALILKHLKMSIVFKYDDFLRSAFASRTFR